MGKIKIRDFRREIENYFTYEDGNSKNITFVTTDQETLKVEVASNNVYNSFLKVIILLKVVEFIKHFWCFNNYYNLIKKKKFNEWIQNTTDEINDEFIGARNKETNFNHISDEMGIIDSLKKDIFLKNNHQAYFEDKRAITKKVFKGNKPIYPKIIILKDKDKDYFCLKLSKNISDKSVFGNIRLYGSILEINKHKIKFINFGNRH